VEYPKISVITICFNCEKTIQDTIDSIRNQNYPNLEYIIIDGKSTDKTIQIVKKNMEIVSKFVCENDQGPADAENKGLMLATGEYVNFLNADDIYADNMLFEVARAIKDNKDIEIVSTGAKVYSSIKNKVILESASKKNINFKLSNFLLKHSLFNAHFFKRELALKYYPIKTKVKDQTYFISSDNEYLSRIAIDRPRHFLIEKPLYIYNSHPGSITLSRKNIIKIRYERLEIVNSLIKNNQLTSEELQVANKAYKRSLALLLVLGILKLRITDVKFAIVEGFKKRGLFFLLDIFVEPLQELVYRISVSR
jgi:glycosyltransferase involved in cell wall biosynthesis